MEYDLIVIGAGPGGYEAAFEAADLGMKTALIEKEEPGGTCLNHGCIPTKALLHAAELYRGMREAEALGVSAGNTAYDPRKTQEWKRDVVLRLRKGIADTARRKKVDLIRGFGTVCGEGRVLVRGEAEERTLTAGRILIATGSRPAMPPVEGADLPGVVTSDELLENEEKISSLVIIGGGVIGVEFAALYEALGTKVTVITAERGLNAPLPGKDKTPVLKRIEKTEDFKLGKRPDHDRLPEEIQALYAENLSLMQNMRACHAQLVLLTLPENQSNCPDGDRYPFVKEIIELDARYHANWEKYDTYPPVDDEQ